MDPFALVKGLVQGAQMLRTMCLDAKKAKAAFESVAKRLQVLSAILEELENAPRSGSANVIKVAIESVKDTFDKAEVEIKITKKAIHSFRWKFKAKERKEALLLTAADVSRDTSMLNGAMMAYMLSVKEKKLDVSQKKGPTQYSRYWEKPEEMKIEEKKEEKKEELIEENLPSESPAREFFVKYWPGSDVIRRADFFVKAKEVLDITVPPFELGSDVLLTISEVPALDLVFKADERMKVIEKKEEPRDVIMAPTESDEHSEEELKNIEEATAFITSNIKVLKEDSQKFQKANEEYVQMLSKWGSQAAGVTNLEEDKQQSEDQMDRLKLLKDRARTLSFIYDYMDEDDIDTKNTPELKDLCRKLKRIQKKLGSEPNHPLHIEQKAIDRHEISPDEAEERKDALDDEIDDLTDAISGLEVESKGSKNEKKIKEAEIGEHQVELNKKKHELDMLGQQILLKTMAAQKEFGEKKENNPSLLELGGDAVEKLSGLKGAIEGVGELQEAAKGLASEMDILSDVLGL